MEVYEWTGKGPLDTKLCIWVVKAKSVHILVDSKCQNQDAATEFQETECLGDRVPSDRVSSDPVPNATEYLMVIECLVTQNHSKSNRKVVASYC